MCKIRHIKNLLSVLFIGLLILMLGSLSPAEAQFYKGKTIRLVVNAAPGGSFDLHSRLLSRHIGKHIAGDPTVIVDNMPGGGGLVVANYIYKMDKPEGLTIGATNGSIFLQKALGIIPGVEFEAQKFIPLGVTFQGTDVLVLKRDTGIKNAEELINSKKPVRIGVSSPGSNLYDYPAIIKEALGLQIRLVSGYKSFADIRLAIEGGEAEGISVSWETIRRFWGPTLLKNNEIVPIVQTALTERLPDLPNVPTAMELAKTEEARQLIKHGILDPNQMLMIYLLPPATPKDRVDILRKAFDATVKDPKFLADAEKSNAEIRPIRGSELEKTIAGVLQISPSIQAKLRGIMSPKK